MYVQALLGTWWMSLVSFAFAMLLALIITVFRVCPIKPLRVVGDLYVQIFRNIPGVSLLIILVYALPYLKIVMDYRLCVIVTVILVASAFGSENFMSGINTIGVGQIEAARSLGMGFGKMLRLVVIPQALRSAVLPMTNLLCHSAHSRPLGPRSRLPPGATGLVSYINTRTVGGILPFVISALMYAGTAFVIGVIGNAIDKKVSIVR